MISWTNLITRATVPDACFLLFLVLGKSENEYSRNWTGQKPKCLFFPEDSRSQNTRRRRARGWPHPPRRGLGLAAQGHGVVALGTPSVSLFAYKKPSDIKTLGGLTFFQKEFRSTVTTRFHKTAPETPFWHPVGTGNWRRSSPSSSPLLLDQPSMFPPSMSNPLM